MQGFTLYFIYNPLDMRKCIGFIAAIFCLQIYVRNQGIDSLQTTIDACRRYYPY